MRDHWEPSFPKEAEAKAIEDAVRAMDVDAALNRVAREQRRRKQDVSGTMNRSAASFQATKTRKAKRRAKQSRKRNR